MHFNTFGVGGEGGGGRAYIRAAYNDQMYFLVYSREMGL